MVDVKRMREELLEENPTLYCSVMAHLRGKLHMTKLNGGTVYEVTGRDCWSYFGFRNKECIADERRHMFHWTMENQAKFVAETINKYSKEEGDEDQEQEEFVPPKAAVPVLQPSPERIGLMGSLRSWLRRAVGA